MFIDDLDGWVRSYQIYAKKANEGHLVAVLALKDHIEDGLDHYRNTYAEDEEKQEYFETVFKGLQREYNPDSDINKLQNTLICIEIKRESYLHSQYGDKICGKFLSMSADQMITKLLNKETGEYEEETANIVINMGYPTPDDLLKVSFLDISKMEAFS